MFNTGDTAPEEIRVTWSDLGLPPVRTVRDLWTKTELGKADGGRGFAVEPHALLLLPDHAG